ncbi:MAG: energy-coupling factor ABC transporter substrate-binding protein [Methanofastidiosum sp.]|jgi:cobalt/nickel transport protein|nr:energy-coupling factor ABC transporter substrate-binding protein [Bacteroidales bacterium]
MKGEIIAVISILIFAVAFVVVSSTGSFEWGGADGEAENVIAELNPEFEPIAQPLWEPPSGEIESLFFSLQAAIGGLIIGYFLGFYKGKQ